MSKNIVMQTGKYVGTCSTSVWGVAVIPGSALGHTHTTVGWQRSLLAIWGPFSDLSYCVCVSLCVTCQ